ncbi:MAG TPA: VOC family protein [Pyrinomonadaceae bacterium]|jgi:catechol 2,3-dioxygenase-like lactoylglutathione lyase family enzyme|nr:VOC family protein [Pyrinomonadaceae bacterium]
MPIKPIKVEGGAPLLQVFDMPALLAFYRDKLGFEVTMDSGQGDDSSWVMLQLGDVTLMLNDQYEPGHRPDAPPAERTRWHDDTAVYFGCPDVDAAYEHITGQGIEAKAPYITGYGFKAIDLADPDGYRLCFHWPENNK